MKHPLISERGKHYDLDGKPVIFTIEDVLTVDELIGACKFNIMKYGMRKKGTDVLDAEKAKDYTRYLGDLRLLQSQGLSNYTVTDARKQHATTPH